MKSLTFLTLIAAAGAALSPLPLLAVGVVALGLLVDWAIHAWAEPLVAARREQGGTPGGSAPPASPDQVIATIYVRSGRLVLRRRE